MASLDPPIKGAALRVPFSVFDYSGNLLVGATFGVLRVDKDFGGQSVAVNTVVEVGNGEYSLVLTAAEMNADVITVLVPVTSYPDLTITITTAAYNFDTIAAIVSSAVAALVEDGYTWTQIMSLIGAALAGKVSGAPTNPVFRAMDDSANRITSVTDSSGNRTTVTLTP